MDRLGTILSVPSSPLFIADTVFGTVDLSRFTCLRQLDLCLSFIYLDKLTASLASVLSTATTHRLEKLILYYNEDNIQPLDFILDALSGLEDVDAILSLPNFRRLHHIQFEIHFLITMQWHQVTSNPRPPISSSDTILASDSSSQQDLDENDSTNDQYRTFQLYAENAVRNRIEEKLKQLNSRGILDIKLYIEVEEQMRAQRRFERQDAMCVELGA